MNRGEAWFLGTLAAVMGVSLLLGAAYFQYSWLVMRLPVTMTILILALCGLRAVELRRAGNEPGGGRPAMNDGVRWANVGWVAASLPILLVCGFIAGAPLYMLAYVRAHSVRWRTAIAVSVVVLVFVYGFIDQGLHIPLPRGLIVDWFARS